MVAALIDAVDRAGRDEAVRVILLTGRGRPLLRRVRHRRPATRSRDGAPRPRAGSIQRRLPSQAHRLIPLLVHACRRRWCARSRVGRRDRPEPRARSRLHRRRHRRPVLGAVRRARVHARQRRHLAAAAPDRRDAAPRDDAARHAWSRRRGRRVGDGPPRRTPSTELDAEATAELVGTLADGPTVALGLTQVAAPRGRDGAARRAPPQRGVRDGAVVARRRLPRGAQRVQREAAARDSAGADVLRATASSSDDGPVGWLVFDRPEVGNAMNAAMMTELEQAWRELDADPAVRVIVNTGEGRDVPDRPRRRRSSAATRRR